MPPHSSASCSQAALVFLTRAMRSQLQLCAEGRRRGQLALGMRRPLHAATARRAACRCKAADSSSSSRSAVPAIGIDLGTTSSAIAVVGPDGRPHIVHDAQGPAVVPSVVHFAKDGQVLVGRRALDAGTLDAASTFFSAKRLIGRTFAQVQGLLPGLTYKVVEGPAGSTLLACDADDTSTATDTATTATTDATPVPDRYSERPALLQPEQVSAHVLRHLLRRAQAHLQQQQPQQPAQQAQQLALQEAVITVPAYFTPEQRRATVRAAQLAGLRKATLLQEPVAAAMAYGFGKPTDWDTILVFDLGGGTLDLSLLESFEGIMEVVATGGDARLGGDDFTDAAVAALTAVLPQHVQQQLKEGSVSPAFRLALRRAAEAAKEVLSSQQEATVQLPADPCTTSSSAPASTAVSNGGVASAVSSPTSSVTLTGERLEVTLTREQLEAACQSLVVRLWPPLEALLKDTRTQLSGKTPQLLPEWQQQQQQQRGASAAGAALGQGEGESGSGVATSAAGAGGSVDGDAPSTPRVWGRQFEVFAGGAADSGAAAKYAAPPRRLTGVVLVGAATRMPGVRRFIQHVTGLEPASGVDPEAVVALGAATYSGVLQGSSSGVELTDSAYVAELHNRASAMLSDWQA